MKVDMVVMRHANPGAAYFCLKNVKQVLSTQVTAHMNIYTGVIRQLFY
jgi:hypothetical protein